MITGSLIYVYIMYLRSTFKVHIFWEGHKFLRNLHGRFVLCSNGSNLRWRFHKTVLPSQNIWTLKAAAIDVYDQSDCSKSLSWKFSATPLTVVVLLSCLYVRLWKKNRSFLLGEAIALGEENRLTRNGQLIFWLAARSNLEELHNEAKIVFKFLCSFKNKCSRGLCFLDFKFKPSQQCTILHNKTYREIPDVRRF